MQSKKKRLIFLLLIAITLFVTDGKAQDMDWKEMESAEKEFNERQAKELVAYMSLNTMFPDEHVRALADAAGKGKVEKVEELIVQGINVNSRGTRNATPLFWAMKNFDGFEKLLELGADPNIIFDDGGNVINRAIRIKDKKFLVAIFKHGGNPNLVSGQFNDTPLFKAAGPEGKSKVGILLDAGADINAQRLSGDTPVMVAAGLGQFDLVYELLGRGADFNIKNKNGKSLSDVIVFRKKTMDPKNELTQWMGKVIEWLTERGVHLPQ